MKNYTTPRTMADCTFVTGYSTARKQRASSMWGNVLYVVLSIGAIALYIYIV